MINFIYNTNNASHSYTEKKHPLERHVIWLKESSSHREKIGKTILLASEIALAALFLITLPIVVKYASWLKQIQSKKAFELKVAEASPPDQELVIQIKSPTHSFNHVQEFALKNGIIWERPLHSKEEWTALQFDGDVDGKIPCSLDCDGANLVILDQDNKVHYKKVIEEYRTRESDESSEYHFTDISKKMEWRDKWFYLPVVCILHNLIFGKRLQVDPDARAWAISHRGIYNDYLEDSIGNKAYSHKGVTTLYVLDAEGKKIERFDPWSTKFGGKDMCFPETSKSAFNALNLKAAASTLMLIGYERTKGEDVERLIIKTKLSDIDSDGSNPFLKYTYNPEDGVEDRIQVLPLPDWESHPLDLQNGEKLTKQISIIQTGVGNAERGLIVAGTKWIEGELKGGFYFKKLNEQNWQFEEDDTAQVDELLNMEIPTEGDFQSNVRDYHSSFEEALVRNSLKSIPEGTVSVKSFGNGTQESRIKLVIGRKTYKLTLYKKKTLKHFIGIPGWSYDLVIPDEHKKSKTLKKYLGKANVEKGVMEINVKDTDQGLRLIFPSFMLCLS